MITGKIVTTDGNVEVMVTVKASRDDSSGYEQFVAEMVTDAVVNVLNHEQMARQNLRFTRLVWE